VLDDEVDLKMLRDRIGAMRKAAQDVSPAQRKKVDVPWGDLKKTPTKRLRCCGTVAKKVTPKILAELRPLVNDTPEAAFLISPEAMKPAAKRRQRPRASGRRSSEERPMTAALIALTSRSRPGRCCHRCRLVPVLVLVFLVAVVPRVVTLAE